jgi:von Willebrand factor type A domain
MAPHSSGARRAALAWALSAAALFGLSACGGGGGGSSPAETAALPGVVAVTVLDSYGTAVAGARIRSPRGDTTTNAQGLSLVVTDAPGATANVTVSRDSFLERSVALASTVGRVNEVTVTLDRATSAAGGSLTSRSGALPTVDSTGQQVSFEIELVVVDGASRPIEALPASAFALRPCRPDAGNEGVECVRGAVPSEDVGFTPVAAAPETVALVPGGASRPFATALLLDQSGSIAQTDPTNARLYSAKAFLGGMAAQDRVLLAAFAGAPGAVIPTAPLTVYGPFKGQPQATAYYATLDTLGPLIGGNTPLYDSIDALSQQWLGPSGLPDDMGKALVVFTDGADTTCAGQAACLTRREQTVLAAQQNDVRIFAIGLSGGADLAALGELASQTGGALLYADNTAQLVPLYGAVGALMNLALPTYRLRFTVRSDAAGGFRSGQTVLGRVQVTAGNSTFDVPFVVALP